MPMIIEVSTGFNITDRYLRLRLHVVFWVLMYLFFIYLKMPLLGLPFLKTALIVLKDVFMIGLIFYFLSYYVVPELVLKKRFVLLILSLILVYYFYSFMLLVEFWLLPKIIDIPGRGYQAYARRLLDDGVLGILQLRHVAEILLDLSYMLSPALIVKLIVSLIHLSRRALRLEVDNVNLELAFLKSQLNPHFLFNTLNNVYSLALSKSDQTADMVQRLADLMRYTLYDSNASQVRLDKEIIFFQNYIELERMRHRKSVTIEFEVQCASNDLKIAPLILFPFIENACKHGVTTSVLPSMIAIRIWLEHETLHVSIRNSLYPGASSPKLSGGIGIQNAIKRLNLLYAGNHTLRIQKEENVFDVTLWMNLT